MHLKAKVGPILCFLTKIGNFECFYFWNLAWLFWVFCNFYFCCRKPTDCAVLLYFQSNHSLKCKEIIIFSQALRYNPLTADDTILQKELDFLTVSLLARKFSLEIITRNISKALLHSRDTILHRTPRASSSRIVLRVVTPYSLEGRQFSKSVWDHWYIEMIHNYTTSDPTPITTYHKTETLNNILVHSCQEKPTSLCSAPTKHCQ